MLFRRASIIAFVASFLILNLSTGLVDADIHVGVEDHNEENLRASRRFLSRGKPSQRTLRGLQAPQLDMVEMFNVEDFDADGPIIRTSSTRSGKGKGKDDGGKGKKGGKKNSEAPSVAPSALPSLVPPTPFPTIGVPTVSLSPSAEPSLEPSNEPSTSISPSFSPTASKKGGKKGKIGGKGGGKGGGNGGGKGKGRSSTTRTDSFVSTLNINFP
jgi:hypothetical protein